MKTEPISVARADETAPGHARLFSISPGRPFLETLARAVLAGDLPVPGSGPPDPLALADITIILPTRRAVRALQGAFLGASEGRALLLPRLVPVGDADEDETLIGLAGDPGRSATALTARPTIGSLERQLTLTILVLEWARRSRRRAESEPDGALEPVFSTGRETPAGAVRLAADLARLIDALETEGVALGDLERLVPDHLAAHWQQTTDFLSIITQFWPLHLAETGLISPAARRDQMIRDEVERVSGRDRAAPVIVAGVTGSVPATIDLMAAVARLPRGAVVLPALDPFLDDDTWQTLADHPEHPQHGLAHVLAELGVPRAAVGEVPGLATTAAILERTRLISEAMRPAGSLDRWGKFIAAADRDACLAALAGVSRIDAPSAADEAAVIALMLRHALEEPGRTAALVTPDRLLARRVAAHLAGLGIEIDDSAGVPLAKTPPGALLELIMAATSSRLAPAPLMALLKHPLTRLGLPPGEIRRAARTLEIAALRTVYLGEGLSGLLDALARAERETLEGSRRHPTARRLRDEDWARARDLLARLGRALAPFDDITAQGEGPLPLHTLAAAHVAAAEALAEHPPGEDVEGSPLWQGEVGACAEQLLRTLMDEALPAPSLGADDYPEVYRTLSRQETVRPRVPVHPRLSIWGPFEARLQQPDLVILGALNEGTWPEIADAGPWLNRGMRDTLGLPSPELTIGRAAHDVTALLGAGKVVLTRSTRIDGAPTTPSRWLLRIDALLGGLGIANALVGSPEDPDTDRSWLAWARHRDATPDTLPVARPPEPRPAVALRPRRLSVSDVESWIANPYAIFARHILRLEPLAALGERPGPQQRGTIVHEALARFTHRHPEGLPEDIAAVLTAITREVLAAYAAHPRVAAFWIPRLERFATWIGETEVDRRSGGGRVLAEVNGEIVIAAPAGPFKLRARADRIDVRPDGLVITDYKTGVPPNDKAVARGLSPQLPLEAAMAMAGGFAGVPAERAILRLSYIRATGGEPAGEERLVKHADLAALGRSTLADLARLVAQFDVEATPYKAVRRPDFRYDFDDYAHLARAAEWSAAGDDADDEGGAR